MWIPKLLNVAMNLKERFQMTSNAANPKASLTHQSSTLPSSTSSPHAPKDQQRHTSLTSFPCSTSIRSPSSTHILANGSTLDAKEKEHKAKNPQKSKDQHVPSKRHVQEKKNLIQNQIKGHKG